MELRTIKSIAQELNVPESNLRYYVNRYGDFIPSQGVGRKKRYLPQAQVVFEKIIDLINRNTSPQEIEQILAKEFSRDIDVIERETATAKTEQQQLEIQQLKGVIVTLAQKIQQLEITQNENRIAMLEHFKLVDEALRAKQEKKKKIWQFWK